MAAHTIVVDEFGRTTYEPDHDLEPGVCGWVGRPLTISEEVEYAQTGSVGGQDVEIHEANNHLVLSRCQYVGVGPVRVSQECPTIETAPA